MRDASLGDCTQYKVRSEVLTHRNYTLNNSSQSYTPQNQLPNVHIILAIYIEHGGHQERSVQQHV
jgi:hypothetical protein